MPESAVIVGAGLSGLLAARVLADTYHTVTLVERDSLPDAPLNREGVPQSHHAHILLKLGLDIISELFPNFVGALDEYKIPELSWTKDIRLLRGDHWLPTMDLNLTTRAATRPLLEWVIRQQVAQLANVKFMSNQRVVGYQFGKPACATGIKFHTGQILETDLIIDASGRNSKTTEWLSEQHFTPPPEEVVNAHVGYSSRLYESLKTSLDYKMIGIGNRAPNRRQSGTLILQENGIYIVTLAGVGKQDQPPTDEEGFLDFAKSLASTDIYEVIKNAVPASPIRGYRDTQNRRRRYDQVVMPTGLVVFGEALCSFNPVYAQGMTAAAIQARILRNCVRQQHYETIHAQLLNAIKTPWLIATGADLAFPETDGIRSPGPTVILQRYIEEYSEIMGYHKDMTKDFVNMINMTKPPTALFAPSYIFEVMLASLHLHQGSTQL
jgi:2-polyprenyl-6-methoxyphenol hydroxylase-like FAD-dependent oxidoreductase